MRILTLILFISGVIIISGCSIASSKTFHLKDILLINNSSEIQEIKIKRLDISNPDTEVIEKKQIEELWNYLNTINFLMLTSSNNVTYKGPTSEYEINIFHSKGNEVIQIKNQGAFLYKGADSYRITNKNLDLSYLDDFLNK